MDGRAEALPSIGPKFDLAGVDRLGLLVCHVPMIRASLGRGKRTRKPLPASLSCSLPHERGSEIMFGHGKCPKCEKEVMQADMESITVGDTFSGPFFRGVSICCPQCKTILGVIADPASMASDIASQIERNIREKR